MPRLLLLLIGASLAALALAPVANAVTFTVDDTGDRPDEINGDGSCTTDLGPGECTLRAAVEEANALAGVDGVSVPAGTFDLLTQLGGAIEITGDVTILGDGARSTLIRQERDDVEGTGDRVFDVQGAATTVTIAGVTIANGWAQPAQNFWGGNIRNTGNLTVVNSTITGGRASSGGGIGNIGGTLTVENSTITGNSAPDGGGDSGGIQNFEDASSNTATLIVRNSTISGNSANLGGGIYDWNQSSPGPPGNSISITNSTITGNASGFRGGGGGLVAGADGVATVTNTIIAGNTSLGEPLNCSVNTGGSLVSSGDNIESGADCGFAAAGDLQLTDPLLGPLADNGGPTDTHAIALFTPPWDAANPAACPPTDQRGVGRPQGVGCDIGAFEISLLRPSAVTGSAASIDIDNATVTGSVDPGGFTAEWRFEYGTSTAYGSQTAPASAGGSGAQPVSASLAGLESNTTYHYRLIASTLAGGALGADGTFATPRKRLADLPPPVLGRLANAEPTGGRVRVCVDGERACLAALRARSSQIQKGQGFVPLEEARQVPMGSFFDTTRGTVRLESATLRQTKSQRGRFSSGLFQMLQSRARRAKGLTQLRLKGSSFDRCRTRRRAKPSGASAGASALSKKTIRKLRADANGKFQTGGKHSAATVRGTVWITADRCDGTLTTVKRGKVSVRDFRRKRTITLRAGKSYLARAPG